MNSLVRLMQKNRGALFHLLCGMLVFAVWRVTGMPSPGGPGRLVPAAWLLTGLLFGRGGIPRYSAVMVFAFTASAVFWAFHPFMYIIASSCALLGIFPGLLRISSKKAGPLLAVLPLAPLVLLLVPFTGDEPHYASITERLFPGDGTRFDVYASQAGDPAEGVSHHHSFYPALLLPGYPMGEAGIRSVNLIFAFLAVALLTGLLAEEGIAGGRKLSAMTFLTLPGAAVLGLVYPEWLALAVFLAAVRSVYRGGNRITVLAAALVLVMIKVRFIGLSAGLLGAIVIETKGRKRLMLPLLLLALSAAVLLADRFLMDGSVFLVRYGGTATLRALFVQPVYRYGELALALFSTILDIESGLLWKAPWVLAGLAGIPDLRSRNPRLFLWLGLPSLLYLMALLFWSGQNWSAMPTPAGRMLLPLVPLLAASLGHMTGRRGTRILIWISMALAAVHYCHPYLRFNLADGSDALVTSFTGPFSDMGSWVPVALRPSLPVFALWAALSGVLVLSLRTGTRFAEYLMGSAFLFVCVAGGMRRTEWEAEELPPEYRDHCSLYPTGDDPELRKFWLFGSERMLLLSHRADAVRLPVPNGRDSFDLVVECRMLGFEEDPGFEVSCGNWSDSVFSSSVIMDPPEWVDFVRGGRLPLRPENLSILRFRFSVPSLDDTVFVRPLPVEGDLGRLHGVYLDRITIR